MSKCGKCPHSGHVGFCEAYDLTVAKYCGCYRTQAEAYFDERQERKHMVLKDSGERVQHETGAVRDSAKGRGRPDLLSPIMLHRVAVHLEAGAEKYEERNWEKGLPVCRAFASLLRHVWLWFQRYDDEDHLAAVVCNAMFIMHTLEMVKRGRLPATLDDRPDYRPKAETGEPRLHVIPADTRASLIGMLQRLALDADREGDDAYMKHCQALRDEVMKS